MSAKCPECGRFLRNDFVRDLAAGAGPCPRCGTLLTPDRFPADVLAEANASAEPPPPVTEASAPESAEQPAPELAEQPAPESDEQPAPESDEQQALALTDEPAASVRPPDLPPASVRATDPLDGWDDPIELDQAGSGGLREALAGGGFAHIATVAGAGLAGGLAGRALLRKHPGLGALAGGVLGAGAALSASRRAKIFKTIELVD